MEVLVLVFTIFSIFMAIFLFSKQASEKQARSETIKQAFDTQENFEATKKIVGISDYFALAFDQHRKKIMFVKDGAIRYIPFSQILDVELIEDNNILFQKSSLRTIGGAFVGGALAGGTGAIVGGLSGNTKQSKTVSKVQVKIKMRDIKNPSLTLDCYDCSTMEADKKPVNPSSTFGAILYEVGTKIAQEIVDTLSVIIDENNHINTATPTVQPKSSVADELSKLAELKEKGILSQEEFEKQKRVLLS